MKQQALAEQGRQLAPFIEPWLVRARDLGRDAVFPDPAAVPGGLQGDDRLYRTDLHMLCYYDSANARWLTVNEFVCALGPSENNTFAATFAAGTYSAVRLGQLRQDYQPVLTRFDATFFVVTTNNGSNYWSYGVRDSTNVQLLLGSTAADAANANLPKIATSFTQPGAARSYLYLDLVSTGAPGAIFPRNPLIHYRLVVT